MPCVQNQQCPSTPPIHETPTRVPNANSGVAPPITSPTIWCPGIKSVFSAGKSPSTICKSVRQTPHAETRSISCPGPATGRATSRTSTYSPAARPGTNTAAFIPFPPLKFLATRRIGCTASPNRHPLFRVPHSLRFCFGKGCGFRCHRAITCPTQRNSPPPATHSPCPRSFSRCPLIAAKLNSSSSPRVQIPPSPPPRAPPPNSTRHETPAPRSAPPPRQYSPHSTHSPASPRSARRHFAPTRPKSETPPAPSLSLPKSATDSHRYG